MPRGVSLLFRGWRWIQGPARQALYHWTYLLLCLLLFQAQGAVRVRQHSTTQLHRSLLFSTGSRVYLAEEVYPGRVQRSHLFIREVLKCVY